MRDLRLKWLWPVAILLAAALLGWGVGLLLPVKRPAPPPAAASPGTATTPDEIIITDQPEPPLQTPLILPATAPQLTCYFRLERVAAGTALQAAWKLGAQDLGALAILDLQLDRQPYLAGHFTFKPPAGAPTFAPGIYQLFLRYGTQVLVETSFVVAVDAEKILAQQPPPGGEIRVINLGLFGSIGPQNQPQQPSKVFSPAAKIYAVFTYLNGIAGKKLTVRWFSAGVEIPQAVQEVTLEGGARQAFAWLQAGGAGLPEGAYAVQIFLPDHPEPAATADFTIKAGAVLAPVPAPIPAPR